MAAATISRPEHDDPLGAPPEHEARRVRATSTIMPMATGMASSPASSGE